MSKRTFPKKFYWGASTASHQVEGGNHNQWTVWELAHAAEQARTAEQRYDWLPNWPDIKKQAQDPHNYVSGKGVDHYRRYEEDFDILQKLHLNAFRFTIEWSRLEPEEGEWDQAAIDHYKQYIAELRKRGSEPFLNIWHWTNPVWFEEKGAFTKHANLKYFYRFAEKVAQELAIDLRYVIILNEPNNYAWYSYLDGIWPPGEKSFVKFLTVYFNLTRAHRGAYKRLKRVNPKFIVTSVPQLVSNQPQNPKNLWHRFGAWSADIANNWVWYWLTGKRTNDYIGYNNYFKNYVTGVGVGGIHNPQEPLNDMGWFMEPSGVAEIARKIHKKYPKKDLIITENGVADATDQYRQWWMEETIASMEALLAEGVPLKGYFHWSLLDNFEWHNGWWPKFGLVEVDREHGMKRTVRPSAKWLASYLLEINKP